MLSVNSGYDMSHLYREAQTRWLKPVEVYFILQNYEEQQLTHQVLHKPSSGSLYLFNKRVIKFFRKDGHRWRRRKDQRTIAEAHERLKVGNIEGLNCYYARGEDNPNFQRRSYWILDPAHEHIVLVHYRDTEEGRQNARSMSHLSTSTFSPSPNSFARNQPESSFLIGEAYELSHNQSSPRSVEISSREIRMNQLDIGGGTREVNDLSEPDLSQALQRIEQQLSLNDDVVRGFNASTIDNDDGYDTQDASRVYDLSGHASNDSNSFLLQQHLDDNGIEIDDIWNEMFDSKTFPDVDSRAQADGQDASNSSLLIPQEVDSMGNPVYSPELNAYGYGMEPNSYSSLFDQAEIGIPLDDNICLTIAHKQKFTIRQLSPEWCYTNEGAKIVIIGSFFCDSSECEWACMFGDTEVPVEIIQEGILCCHAPPQLQGTVTLCITSGNRESCSEFREFEYRARPSVCTHTTPPQTENKRSSEELLLLVRLVQMLLSTKGDVSESKSDVTIIGEDSWSELSEAILDGTSTSSRTIEWLLEELLKDKFEVWLSSQLRKNNNQTSCGLLKKEQDIIHMVAGLGFEWALQPILNSGVSVDFRDINGWTALHWAARFGREKMVAALIASGASARAVTDPNSQDPKGKVPASIAAASGHMGLAGYLSEVALTSHLSSLTLTESEMSKASAAVETERTVNSLSVMCSSTNEDQASLENTLAAVRNAAQAAARIQSAFRAHSFRKRQQREAADEFRLVVDDIRGLSAASKLAFGNAHGYNTAALSIQKKYRGWKGRRAFLSLRQKIVNIQAHVRGYQARKYYKVLWAVSILEKVVLRWRRCGVGLRGFQADLETIEEEDDILKVFRKRTMDPAIDEAVSRVLSMVESSEARQQYHRLLQKYRQAKAELNNFVLSNGYLYMG